MRESWAHEPEERPVFSRLALELAEELRKEIKSNNLRQLRAAIAKAEAGGAVEGAVGGSPQQQQAVE